MAAPASGHPRPGSQRSPARPPAGWLSGCRSRRPSASAGCCSRPRPRASDPSQSSPRRRRDTLAPRDGRTTSSKEGAAPLMNGRPPSLIAERQAGGCPGVCRSPPAPRAGASRAALRGHRAPTGPPSHQHRDEPSAGGRWISRPRAPGPIRDTDVRPEGMRSRRTAPGHRVVRAAGRGRRPSSCSRRRTGGDRNRLRAGRVG